MKITELDLEIEDIEWYGVDETGKIGLFMSGGSLAVPGFICKSRDDLEKVCDFFDKLDVQISNFVDINNDLVYQRQEFITECKHMSQKGIYCFDISDDKNIDNKYIFVSKPEKPLLLDKLPIEIQTIMLDYRIMGANFEVDDAIIIWEYYVIYHYIFEL